MLPEFVLILMQVFCVNAQEGLVVYTNYGPVQGALRQTESGQVYQEYLGVPYAAPPVGDKRWRKPEVPESWTDVRNATEFGAHCTHFTADNYLNDWGVHNITSEDCLFINIWVPGENRADEMLPVIFYVHGGGFYSGSGALYPVWDLGLYGDVIVTTINYRLGTLGFLSTEDEASPGNYGLWDCLQALQWVKENIAAFGGDADTVTVFGYSAGGAIASHLAITPYSDGLMQRGIALSGQASGFYGVALPGSPAKSAETLARTVGCRRYNDSFDMVECLRGVDSEEVDFWGFVGTILFRRQLPNMIPVIDGDFVPQHPELSWRNGAAAGIDFLTGHSQHDSQAYVTWNGNGSPEDPFNFAATNESMEFYFNFSTAHYPQGEDGVDAIFERYTLLGDDDMEVRTKEMVRATTDWWFDTYRHVEGFEHARTRNDGKKTYCHCFKYRQSFLQYPHDWITASHADEYYSFFGYNYKTFFREDELGEDFDENDFMVSDMEMRYFTNFAKTGNPNEGLPVDYYWPEYTADTKSYLEMSLPPVVANETQDQLDTYHFWQVEFQNLVNPQGMIGDTLEEYKDDDFELEDEDIYTAVEAIREHLHAVSAMSQDRHDFIDERIDMFIEKRLLRQLALDDYK